jgi:hypothetical protein
MLMKSLIHFFALCLLVTQFIACKKDVTNPSSSLPVTAGAIAGNFTIGSLVSAGNQNSTFNDFAFTFKENGTIIATKGSETFSGTWRFDDSNNTEIKISFTDIPLDQLNGSWHIQELNDDHFYLTDDSEHEDPNDDNPSHHISIEFERD